MSIDFYELSRPDLQTPAHVRTVGVDDGGAVFAPACAHPGGPEAALWCAAHDGIAVAQHDSHLYFPTQWLRREIETALSRTESELHRQLTQALVTLDRMELWAKENAV